MVPPPALRLACTLVLQSRLGQCISLKKGRKEGRKEARKQGSKEGRKEGMKEGRKEVRKEPKWWVLLRHIRHIMRHAGE